MSVLPLTLVVIVGRLTEIGDGIHFQAMRPNYLEDVSKLPSNGKPRFAMRDWGALEPIGFTLLTGGSPQNNAVIYDESDEIMLPVQSSAWKKAHRDVGTCGVLESLDNHFYLVRNGC